MAAGLFLVFIGTLAQTRYDIWDVVHKYFRTPFSWVEFRVFFPESFFPELSQYSWSLDLPFGWKLDDGPDEKTVIPAAAPGVEVVIRR